MSTVSDRLKLLDAATNPHTVYRSIAEVALRWGKRATARTTKTTPTAHQTPQETL